MTEIAGLLKLGQEFGFPYLVMIICIVQVGRLTKRHDELIDRIMGPMTNALYAASQLFKLNSSQTGEYKIQGDGNNDRPQETNAGRSDASRLPAIKADSGAGNPFAEGNEDNEKDQ